MPKKRSLKMFKNILVPTDGSKLSKKAAKKAVALAKATGTRMTAFHVAPAYHFELHEDYVPRRFMFQKDYLAKARIVARRHLGAVKKMAESAGVQCAGCYATSDFPADAIVKAAKKYKCDGIVMGSHGRGRISGLFLGSVTQKVLASSKIPVVVVR